MKQKVYKLYGFLQALKYPNELWVSAKYLFNQNILTTKEHISLASEWLLFIQNKDKGYARQFTFVNGRDSSYIETTGYIIPTLLDVSKYLNKTKYRQSAIEAGKWLLSVQNNNGSFSEIDHNKPYAFDTGQVLIGLNRLFQETKDHRYNEAAKKASYWLADHQEEDGSWKKVAYNSQKHTYYTRVAGAMLKYAIENEDEYIQKRALKNIEWVLSEQNENGFFNYASFLEETPAFLHTIVYILEGLLDVYDLMQQEKLLQAILLNANKLKEMNLFQDMLLCSQYNDDYICANKERCITGLAQWSGVCLRLYKMTNDEAFKQIAISTLFYLKSKQIQEGKILKGALPASVPFWGKYGMFSFVNWGNKFFIDSLLMLDQYKISIAQEQESWVGHAFGFNDEVVHTELSAMDMQYLDAFNRYFEKYKNKKLTLLDLGCGRGRFLDYLKKHYPKWKITGIDPTFEKENEILKGSAYSISLPDASVDILFTVEVLQHTYLEQSLQEINRVVKPNGYLVIGERNPLSILGLLKPILELKGKWMYPWDSPFRERWYSLNSWKNFLRKFNFKIEKTEIINNPNDKKIKFLNRYYFMIGKQI